METRQTRPETAPAAENTHNGANTLNGGTPPATAAPSPSGGETAPASGVPLASSAGANPQPDPIAATEQERQKHTTRLYGVANWLSQTALKLSDLLDWFPEGREYMLSINKYLVLERIREVQKAAEEAVSELIAIVDNDLQIIDTAPELTAEVDLLARELARAEKELRRREEDYERIAGELARYRRRSGLHSDLYDDLMRRVMSATDRETLAAALAEHADFRQGIEKSSTAPLPSWRN